MSNQVCPSCSAPAKNIGGSYTTCEFCGRTWVFNKNEGDEVEVYDEKKYLKLKKRADEAFKRFKYSKAEDMYAQLICMICDDFLSTGGGSNTKKVLSDYRVTNLKAKCKGSTINRIIENSYGESGTYLNTIKEDYESATEDFISFRGDNFEDILLEQIEEIEDIIEDLDIRTLIVFIYELFNSFYGYSKQAIVDSSDIIIKNYSVIAFEKYGFNGDTYYENYINNSLLDRDLEKKCYFYKFTLKILNLYYEHLIHLGEEFSSNYYIPDNPQEFGGREKEYDFSSILLELYMRPLKQCSKKIKVSLSLLNNPTFDPKERSLKAFNELIDEYNIFKNNFENHIGKEDIEFSQLSSQGINEDVDYKPDSLIVIGGVIFFIVCIIIINNT